MLSIFYFPMLSIFYFPMLSIFYFPILVYILLLLPLLLKIFLLFGLLGMLYPFGSSSTLDLLLEIPQLGHKTIVGLGTNPLELYQVQGSLQVPLVDAHQVSNDDGCTPGHTCIAMHVDISEFAMGGDEEETLINMVADVVVGLVVGGDAEMKGDCERIVYDGWVRVEVRVSIERVRTALIPYSLRISGLSAP